MLYSLALGVLASRVYHLAKLGSKLKVTITEDNAAPAMPLLGPPFAILSRVDRDRKRQNPAGRSVDNPHGHSKPDGENWGCILRRAKHLCWEANAAFFKSMLLFKALAMPNTVPVGAVAVEDLIIVPHQLNSSSQRVARAITNWTSVALNHSDTQSRVDPDVITASVIVSATQA